MSTPRLITTPLTKDIATSLSAGDKVLLSGYVYAARDAAHKRMVEMLNNGQELPFPLKNQVIYYVGPTPPPPGRPIGAAGPTSSVRMDPYTPRVLEAGLMGMLGKGERSPEVVKAIQQHGAVYFAAYGGIAALLSKNILSSELIAWPDLGTEAVRRLEFSNFPAVVAIDASGRNLYNQLT